jgi:hypothetical protein
MNIINADVETLVKNTQYFVVHSDGEFMLDVFECKGNANVLYGDSLKNVDKQKQQQLDTIGLSDQKHAVKISQKETTFLKISAERAIIRWLPLDFENERGMGYIKYSKGDMKYSSIFKYINIEF